jgi:hypothetical protein
VLSPVHRVGASPAAARRRLPSVKSAAFVTLSLILAAPFAADAEQVAKDPIKTFGDRTLTDADDVFTNEKTVDLVDSVDFGGGSNALTNNGVITLGANASAPVQVSLLRLEAMKNTGLVDLRNGRVGDVLTLSGDYNGSGKARLGLDVGPGGVDRLVVGDVANGKTAVVLGAITAKTATLTGDKGPVLIQAGAGSTKDAFQIENAEQGFVRYSLVQDAGATVTYRLKGEAGQRAYEALKLSEGAGTVWRQAADAWSAHVAGLRDAGDEANGAGVWGQAFGGRLDRDDEVGVADHKVAVDYRQTTYGGQMGVDLVNAGLDGSRVLLGLTGGYADARMRFSGAGGQEARLQVANLGGYLALTRGGYFLNALAKVDRQSIKVRNGPDAIDFKVDGTAYGAQVEAGARSEGDGLTYEKLLSINYVSTRLDDATVFQQRLDFDNATGFVAKAGVRGALRTDAPGGAFTSYGAAFVVHDFTIRNSLDLVGGDAVERLSRDGGRTYGQLTVGLSYRVGGATAFVEGTGDYGGGREGGALRLGARFGF